MKNTTDSSIRFSVITEDSLIQTGYLDTSLSEPTQYVPYIPGNIYLVQEVATASLEDILAAERSGEDLILTLHSQENSQPHLALKDFFTHSGQLYQIKPDGEFIRSLSAQDNPQQGAVIFDAQSLGHIEQQPQSPMLSMLHEVSIAEANDALSPASEAAPAMAAMAALMQDEAPTITHALDQLGSRQGALKSGNVTDDQWAVLEGSGNPSASLEILDNGQVIGEVIVDASGFWRFTPEDKFSESGHVLVARDKTSGQSSESFALIVDSIAPSRAVIDSISSDNHGNALIGKNGYTNDNTPLIKGRAEAFSVVAIYSGKSMIGTAFADVTGAWEFSSIFAFPDGEYTITAKAVDFAGNSGLGSLAYTMTIDTIPPALPTILQAFDDVGAQQGILNSGDLTDDRTPRLSGKAEAGVTVFINDNGKLLGTAMADASGNWSFTPGAPLTDGEHHFTTSARDKAGNTSNAESDAFTLVLGEDRTSSPTIDSVADNVGNLQGLLKHGDYTDDATPTLRGKAQAGDTIKIFDNGIVVGETQADAAGNWLFTPAAALNEGQHAFQVQALNTTHSPSELSPVFEVNLDLTPPDTSNLRISGIYDDIGTITGNVVHGGRTDDQNPTLSGTGPAGETVIVFVTNANGQHEIGRVQVSSNGTWLLEVNETLSLGAHTFTAAAIDMAGNVTPHSPGYKVTVTTNDTIGGFDLNGHQTSGGAINTTVVGNQSNPQVTKLANGNLVVLWQGDNNKFYDVYMQLLDPTGTQKIGREQFVNQRTVSNQDSPQVVALADGGFLVVFESYQASALDNNQDSIFARKYAADGTAQTDEFLVNQTTAGAQRSPAALALPDGGYIISWYSAQSNNSIMQRTYNADNQPVGNEVVIRSGGADSSGGSEMVLLGDTGWYLTVWEGVDSNKTGINGKLRKIDGSATGPDLILNTTQDGVQQYPDVLMLKNGSFVVMWDSSDKQSVGGDIRAAHYSFDPVTGSVALLGNGDFIVNEYQAGKQYKPVGVALNDGGYMLFWGSEGGDGDGSAIFAQRFDANSNKVGHEFLVNPTTWGNQGAGWDNIDLTHILDATLMEDGNIFVTWNSEVIDRHGYGIEGVVVDIDAGFYSEFQVNGEITSNQTTPVTTALPNGNVMVVWHSQDAGNSDIKGQLFNEQGMPIGPEILLSQEMKAYHQFDPAIATLADGTFVVAWASADSANHIRMAHYGYEYDEHGQVIGTVQIGSELVVNPNPSAIWTNMPSITALDDGGYLVTWRKGSSITTMVSRQYDANDQPVTNEVLAGSSAITSGSVSITLADGRVAITYTTLGKGGDEDVMVQIYNPVTHTYSPGFIANQTLPGAQSAPSITTLANGNFVVSWDNGNTTGPDQDGSVYARVYSAAGEPLGNEFIVNTFTLYAQQKPIVQANPNGGFVVVYESQADITPGAGTFGIYMQFFDDNGNRVGQEMQINQIVAGTQSEPDITFLADGRLFVTWTDYQVGDGNGSSIKGRIIDLDGTLGKEVAMNGSNQSATTLLALADDATQGSLWMLFDDGSASGLMLTGESLSAVRGGAGDDVMGITDTSFVSLNGGAGIDTLLLDGRNMALDLDALIGHITGIEKIDLGQGSANSLSLSASALDGLGQTDMVIADGKNQFVINGDSSNTLQLLDTQSESWMDAGEAEIGGVVYHSYVAGATELLVEQNILVTVS
ncbi:MULTISPECIES: Ig-like domain-containing protein [unclassified Serratia (in: enterobacteria)]|uniref:Ig-like domain-containing protein n=1 Tax=unclassified Serratia (in: enterobacteria) TaxID=2647522 RepID=UPI0030766092